MQYIIYIMPKGYIIHAKGVILRVLHPCNVLFT